MSRRDRVRADVIAELLAKKLCPENPFAVLIAAGVEADEMVPPVNKKIVACQTSLLVHWPDRKNQLAERIEVR